jgi:hypothetical protein
MKTQERRRLERDRHTAKPSRLNPQGTEASDYSIQDAEVRGTPAGTAENQQLMFGENGLRNNGPHTAGPNDSHKRGDGMDKEDDEFAHPLSYQFPNPNTFNVLGISPGTSICGWMFTRQRR